MSVIVALAFLYDLVRLINQKREPRLFNAVATSILILLYGVILAFELVDGNAWGVVLSFSSVVLCCICATAEWIFYRRKSRE